MLLPIPVAVGALVLVEDVGRELAALVLPHFVVVVAAVVVVKTVIGVSSFAVKVNEFRFEKLLMLSLLLLLSLSKLLLLFHLLQFTFNHIFCLFRSYFVLLFVLGFISMSLYSAQ